MQDTESLWQNYLVYKGIIAEHDLFEKKNTFRIAYENGTLDFNEVIHFSLNPIAHMDISEQLLFQAEFSQKVLQRNIIPQAIDLVTSHYNQGDTVIILSAGHDFLIRPAAAFFPVHEVLCSTLQRAANGSFLPILHGKPLYREEKLYRLQRWLREQSRDFNTTYFYSDSINDLPLLEYVDIPTAVNPCNRLKNVAQSRGWPILELKLLHLQTTNSTN
jgi:HAD superfamily hydrolase (TIGR01490 family)